MYEMKCLPVFSLFSRARLYGPRQAGAIITACLCVVLAFQVVRADDRMYEPFAAVLAKYVDDAGRVYYEGLESGSENLRAFTTSIARLDSSDFKRWPREERIAFWLNVYNALTLQAIIDNYPIQASFWKSAIYPKESIRQIAGVWDETSFPVMGSSMTLDFIEHEILRKQYEEPRVHMGLVCAASSCPPLRRKPYTGRQLDAQLRDQSRTFLLRPSNFRIEKGSKILFLSSIFEWFGEDFVGVYDDGPSFKNYSARERAVLNFVAQHVSEQVRADVLREDYKVRYLDYDWSLNTRDSLP